MPSVDPTTLFEYGNVLMYNELNFDADEMRSLHTEYVNNLNVGQKNIYDEIMSVVNGDDGGFFFCLRLWRQRENIFVEGIVI